MRFGDVVYEFIRGPFGSSLKKEFFVEHGYKVYEQQNAIYKTIEFGRYFISDEKFQDLKRFETKPDDYILSCSGTIGKLYKLPFNAPNGIINQALLIIRIRRAILLDNYFSFLFNSIQFQRLIIKDAKGTAMLNLAGVKELELVPFPICSLPEQHAIVSRIEQLFSELDKGIESLKTAQQQLKVYRQSVLKWAFEGKLTEKWRQNQDLPDAQELLEKIQKERREKANASGKKLKPVAPLTKEELTALPALPKGWGWVRLGEICTHITDGTHHTPTYVQSGVPFLSVKDIYNMRVNFENCKFITHEEHQELIKRCNPEKDDVLITKSGTIGRLAIVPKDIDFSLFVSVALLKNIKEIIVSEFLLYSLENYINSIDISQDIKGGLLKNFHLEDLRITKIPLCTIEEQYQIVQEIESRLSECDNMEATIAASLQQAEALRQSILMKAFEGRLLNEKELEAVRQDPAWESAERLLERIRAEKAMLQPKKPGRKGKSRV